MHRLPLRLRYKEAGEGEPLLLIHGLQTTSYSWRYVLAELAQTHRVIALDLPGAGASDHPADLGYTPVKMAEVLDAFREGLAQSGTPVHAWDVVGNSLGGAYAAMYGTLFPERVRRLVIIHAPGFMKKAPVLGLELLRRGWVPRALSGLFGPWMVRAFQKYSRPGILSEEEVEQYSLHLRDAEGKKAFWHIIVDGLGPVQAERLPEALARLRCPTLLLWARNDHLIPGETGARWNAAIPGSKLQWVEDSSHFIQVEQPEVTVNCILEFLGKG